MTKNERLIELEKIMDQMELAAFFYDEKGLEEERDLLWVMAGMVNRLHYDLCAGNAVHDNIILFPRRKA